MKRTEFNGPQNVRSGYLLGAFTVADIATFMSLLYNPRLGGPRLEPWPHLAVWYGRVGAPLGGGQGGPRTGPFSANNSNRPDTIAMLSLFEIAAKESGSNALPFS